MSMRMIESPCLGCEDRELGCHSSCEKYIEYQRVREEQKKIIRDQKLSEAQFISYKRDCVKRMNTRKGEKSGY